jgi:hypothetical protein
LPLVFGTTKAATDPGSLGCAWPMLRVSASEKTRLLYIYSWRLKVLL